jgi:peptide chain release factor 1
MRRASNGLALLRRWLAFREQHQQQQYHHARAAPVFTASAGGDRQQVPSPSSSSSSSSSSSLPHPHASSSQQRRLDLIDPIPYYLHRPLIISQAATFATTASSSPRKKAPADGDSDDDDDNGAGAASPSCTTALNEDDPDAASFTPAVEARVRALADNHTALLRDLDAAAAEGGAEASRRAAALARRAASGRPLAAAWAELQSHALALREAEELLADTASASDPELRDLAREEAQTLRYQISSLKGQLVRLLLPAEPTDARDAVLEVRAGVGGEWAADFARDLLDMYSRYASEQGWRVEVLDESRSACGGVKAATAVISDPAGGGGGFGGGPAPSGVYGRLRGESGVHRAQAVPFTEKSGRVQTGTATVAVLPDAPEDDEDEDDEGDDPFSFGGDDDGGGGGGATPTRPRREPLLRESDVKMETFRASGSGGQHVNTTDSAVRLTHVPTGVVVACQTERSQHQNRARALRVLRAKLLERRRAARAAEAAAARAAAGLGRSGAGGFNERVRTYNYVDGRATDHRVGVTVHGLERGVLDGGEGLERLLGAVAARRRSERLESLLDELAARAAGGKEKQGLAGAGRKGSAAAKK